MARLTIRHLTTRPGADGAVRWFWTPSPALRAAGWRNRRVPDDWDRYTDPASLQAAAIAAAQELNAQVDAQRGAALAVAVGQGPTPARDLSALIAEYRASAKFAALAPKTRQGYAQCLGKLEALLGDVPVRSIDEQAVQRLAHKLRATPSYANAVIRVLRLLFEHGRRTGWRAHLPVNPATRPGLVGIPPSGLIWPRAAVEAFVAAADAAGRPSLGTAVLLNEWLGQREGDVLRMSRRALVGGALLVRQGKTGAGVRLPLHLLGRLTDRLNAELARAAAYDPLPSTILVCETTRLPWRPDHFRHEFARVRALAAAETPLFAVDHLMPGRDPNQPDAFTVAMRDLTFMHLRHTAVTRLAEAGCDLAEITAISGHSLVTAKHILERYMVRTTALAERAFQRRLDAEAATAKGTSDVG